MKIQIYLNFPQWFDRFDGDCELYMSFAHVKYLPLHPYLPVFLQVALHFHAWLVWGKNVKDDKFEYVDIMSQFITNIYNKRNYFMFNIM